MAKHSREDKQQAYLLIAASIRTTMQGMDDAGMLSHGIAQVMLAEARAYDAKSTLNRAGRKQVEQRVEHSIFVQPPTPFD